MQDACLSKTECIPFEEEFTYLLEWLNTTLLYKLQSFKPRVCVDMLK